MRPNKSEKKYLRLAYSYFYDIFDEIISDSFLERDKYYRFCKIKDAFSIYAELLNYPPLQWFIDESKKHRPPMEAEIGSELFKFVRNIIVHFPFFASWDEVCVDNDLTNWYKDGLSIDKFLRKYEKHESIKYRVWDGNKKIMTYLSINFPKDYLKGEKVLLKNIISEKEGIIFSIIFMRKVLNTQIDKKY